MTLSAKGTVLIQSYRYFSQKEKVNFITRILASMLVLALAQRKEFPYHTALQNTLTRTQNLIWGLDVRATPGKGTNKTYGNKIS
jgi:hypothetical protein